MTLKTKGVRADLDAAEAARKKRAAKTREDTLAYSLREPYEPTPRDEFLAGLTDSERIFGQMYWHMECKHDHEVVVAGNPSLDGLEPIWMRCPDCDLVRRWFGTKTETKRQEWISYCPADYDMFDWTDLFHRDRSLWRYIHDECLAEMVEGTLQGGTV